MKVEGYRFEIITDNGSTTRSVTHDASYLSASGFRASLSGLRACDELTMRLRNGPLRTIGMSGTVTVSATDTGLQLRPLDVVTVYAVTSDGEVPIFRGDVRQGGNTQNYDLEDFVLRGLHQRLKEVTLPPGSYAQMDGGALARQAIRDTLATGQLGSLTFGPGTPPITITSTSGVGFDQSLIPDLGYSVTITDTEEAPLADLLDRIKQAGEAAGYPVQWGCDPLGRVVMGVLPQSIRSFSESDFRNVTWKPPAAETCWTAVRFLLDRKPDSGTFWTYIALSGFESQYGVRTKTVAVYTTQVPVWTSPTLHATASTGSGVQALTAEQLTALQPETTALTLTGDTDASEVWVALDLPDGASRVTIDAQWAHLEDSLTGTITVPRQGISGPFLQVINVTDLKAPGTPFIQTAGLGQQQAYKYVLADLAPGARVELRAKPGTSANKKAQLIVAAFYAEVPDAQLLGELAQPHYSLPASDPADLELPVWLMPADLTGRVRITERAYERQVERWEYRISAAQGIALGVLTGQADAPEVVARNMLLRRAQEHTALSTAVSLSRT